MKINILLITLLLVNTMNCQTKKSSQTPKTVDNFEIEKYLGTWYELARFNHPFERGLVGVTATYLIRDDGTIKVLNQGYKNSLQGELSQANGKAKIPNANCPSKLKVSFFWFFYADYFVLELDKDYQWAIVGSKSMNYLWILSRKPIVEDSLYEFLVQKAKNLGYNTEKIIKVKQSN